ncbi:hypothetical protein PBI_NINA_29 [Gordonia phage Nina]|uniref:Minor tail protein n=1 Tax=Gordonia phage Nina TaxID=2499026 RepID=A0A3S9UN62_9CAUD|nr:hypothetical protein PBI_NINA_29 [Gordonia phage Nina]
MPIAVGGTSISDVRLGTTPVNKVYLGTTLVWQRTTPYRMTKTNTQNGTGTGYLTLNGMAADSGFPGTLVDSGTTLRIPADASTYSAKVRAEVPHTGGSAPLYGQCQIVRNGSVVATGAQVTSSPGTSWVEWTGIVGPNDTFYISWRGEGNLFTRPTAQSGAFLSVVPL